MDPGAAEEPPGARRGARQSSWAAPRNRNSDHGWAKGRLRGRQGLTLEPGRAPGRLPVFGMPITDGPRGNSKTAKASPWSPAATNVEVSTLNDDTFDEFETFLIKFVCVGSPRLRCGSRGHGPAHNRTRKLGADGDQCNLPRGNPTANRKQ